MARYCELFEEHVGRKFEVDRRDARMLKALADQHGAAHVVAALGAYFNDQDAFDAKSGYDVGLFYKRFEQFKPAPRQASDIVTAESIRAEALARLGGPNDD